MFCPQCNHNIRNNPTCPKCQHSISMQGAKLLHVRIQGQENPGIILPEPQKTDIQNTVNLEENKTHRYGALALMAVGLLILVAVLFNNLFTQKLHDDQFLVAGNNLQEVQLEKDTEGKQSSNAIYKAWNTISAYMNQIKQVDKRSKLELTHEKSASGTPAPYSAPPQYSMHSGAIKSIQLLMQSILDFKGTEELFPFQGQEKLNLFKKINGQTALEFPPKGARDIIAHLSGFCWNQASCSLAIVMYIAYEIPFPIPP